MRALVKLAALLIGTVWAVSLVLPTASASADPIIHEDDPRWDCATMGNLVCGTTDGYLIYFDEYGPWSVSEPVNGEPQCGTDAQCRQLTSGN